MARQGFEPDVRTRRGAAEIVLRNCPFAAAALVDRATVCSLHLGIAQGLAADTPARIEELVAHSPRKAGCLLRIGVADGDAAAVTGTLTLRR